MTAPAPERVDVRDFFRLARRIARRYARALGDSADAESAAFFALAKALRTFDPSAGSFAGYFITAAHHTLYLAVERRQKANGIARRDRIFGRTMRAARPQQPYSFRVVSIDAPLFGAGDDERTAADVVADPALNPEGVLAEKQDGAAARQRIADALSVLNERERRIIEARFFADTPATLDALAAELGGVSKERVRQIEAAALARMRARLEGRAPRKPSGRPPTARAIAITADELAKLSPRERRIAEARLMAAPPATLRALAAELAITPGRVHQLEKLIRQKVAHAAVDVSALPVPAIEAG